MSTTHPQLHILGVRVDDISLIKALQKVESEFASSTVQNFIVTPNPEICLYAREDEHYRRDILDKAFLALPDGFGLKIAARIFGERLQNRITGVDFTDALMERASQAGWRVFLFGGENGVAQRCKEILEEKYKGLEIAGTAQGKMSNQIQNYDDKIIETINRAKANIFLVGLGAPKQEKWIAKNLQKLTTVRFAVAVGGTFDFITGNVKRAPKILRVIGLEWFWRLIVQPRRAPRIFNATLKFIFTVLHWRLRIAFVYRRNVVGLIIKNDFVPLGGCSSAVERLLPKQKIAGSSPATRSNLKILLVERSDEPGHWQLPQGGIDNGETPQDAIWREMKEEIGADTFRIIKHIPNFYRYRWPKVDKLRRGYRGQKQDLFILEFTGEDADIQTDKREHCDFQWVPLEEVEQTAHEIRREQIKRAMKFCNFTVAMPEIITSKISQEKLKAHLENTFGDMVKFVADIEKGILALGGEMHADCEEALLQAGSKQHNLWGANLYPYKSGDRRIEYTSLINIRPSVGNRDMEIKDDAIREKVKELAEKLILSHNEQMA